MAKLNEVRINNKFQKKPLLDESRIFNEAVHYMISTVIIILISKFIEGWLLIGMLLVACTNYLPFPDFLKKRTTNYKLRMKYAGCFNILLDEMICEIGVSLKHKIGDYYLFGTNYRFAPNFKFYIKDCNDFCEIIAPRGFSLATIDRLRLKPFNVDSDKEQIKA